MNITKNQKDLFVALILGQPEMRGILFGLCARTKINQGLQGVTASFDMLELAEFFEGLASFIKMDDEASKR